MQHIATEYPAQWPDYELKDSGNGAKLERFASYVVARPDPRVIWAPKLARDDWDKADASFVRTSSTTGQWNIRKPLPSPWVLTWQHLTFTLKPSDFKHVGIFPEQAVNWQWIGDLTANKPIRVLNLFAYTGGATMAAAASGARVTHVDSVGATIAWAKENIRLSGLETKPIRLIEDDVYKFVKREAKRGHVYDGIIMDPPRFGRGKKGEVFKLSGDLSNLVHACREIVSPAPVFFLMNGYTADLSALAFRHLLEDCMKDFGGNTACGELGLMESAGKRILPSGIFARWTRGA